MYFSNLWLLALGWIIIFTFPFIILFFNVVHFFWILIFEICILKHHILYKPFFFNIRVTIIPARIFRTRIIIIIIIVMVLFALRFFDLIFFFFFFKLHIDINHLVLIISMFINLLFSQIFFTPTIALYLVRKNTFKRIRWISIKITL